MASRMAQCPMTWQAICEGTGVKEKELRRCYKEYKWCVPGLRFINAGQFVHKFA